MDRTIRFPEVEDLPESGNKTINFVHNQHLFWCLQDSRCWIKTPKRESPGVRVSKRIFRVVLLPLAATSSPGGPHWHLEEKAARGTSSGRGGSVRSAPGRWQSRQLGLPLGGPNLRSSSIPGLVTAARGTDWGLRDHPGRRVRSAATNRSVRPLRLQWPRSIGAGVRNRDRAGKEEEQGKVSRDLNASFVTASRASSPAC